MLDAANTTQDDLRTGRAPWSDRSRPTRQALKQDRRCEVLVVGGGITGAMVAEQLVSAGHDVCIVDRERPGFGSTAASTAMLLWEIDRPLASLTDLYGFERAAGVYRRSVQAVSGLRTLARTRGVRCIMRERQSLYLASGNNRRPRAAAPSTALRMRAGLPGTFLDHRTLLARIRHRPRSRHPVPGLRRGRSALPGARAHVIARQRAAPACWRAMPSTSRPAGGA